MANAGRVALVVEDDEPTRNVITDVLSERGFRVLGARNGAEALDRLGAGRPDVMVVAYSCP